jgi:predicted RNase H-like HicB family nuclease
MDYTITINSENGKFRAAIPELPGCSVLDDSPAEAVIRLGHAKIAWLAQAQLEGRPVPKPRVHE